MKTSLQGQYNMKIYNKIQVLQTQKPLCDHKTGQFVIFEKGDILESVSSKDINYANKRIGSIKASDWVDCGIAKVYSESEAEFENIEAINPGPQSFYHAVVRSPEWELWYRHANGVSFDVDESQECAFMSSEHFEAFLDFVVNYRCHSVSRI